MRVSNASLADFRLEKNHKEDFWWHLKSTQIISRDLPVLDFLPRITS
jgi:hypothetical protein